MPWVLHPCCPQGPPLYPSPTFGPPLHASVSPTLQRGNDPRASAAASRGGQQRVGEDFGSTLTPMAELGPGEADFPQQCPRLVLTQSGCCLLLRFALYIICSLAPFQTYLAIVTAEDIYTAGVWNNMENLWSQGPDSHTNPAPGAGDSPLRFCRDPGWGWMGVVPHILPPPPQLCLGTPETPAMGQVGCSHGGTQRWKAMGSLSPLVRLQPSPQHLPGSGASSTHC